ncbi:hypothetical protein BDV36DRAFT_253027, partial [Aspergillus pseudocaelatus]
MVGTTIVELKVDLNPFSKGYRIWIGAKWGSPRQLLIVLWVEVSAAIAGREIIGIGSIMDPDAGGGPFFLFGFAFVYISFSFV